MSALTSLLVRDRIVPVSKIEEALQSQVFLGGDIEVILLEMNVVPEDVLSAYRAALFDLLPATREEVMKASREALRRVPRDVARSLGIVPMHYDGSTLVVAAWEPLYEPRLSEVEAQLGCELSVRIVNQARLASGLAHHYAFELDPRLRRLSESLRRRDPGVVPFVRPPASVSRPLGKARAEEADEGDGEDEVELPMRGTSALADAYMEVEAQVVGARDDAAEATDAVEVAPAAASGEDTAAPPVEAAQDGESLEQLAQEIAEALPEPEPVPPGVSPHLAELTDGDLPAERAVELLRNVSQRDDALFVLMCYARQFFDFVCLFSVAKQGARARMAYGAPLSYETVQSAFLPTPSAGLFAQAMHGKQPALGRLATPAEQELAQTLARPLDRAALLVPVQLSGRVVLAIYVDREREGLTLEDAAVLSSILPAVADVLRRIILENKRRASSSRPPPLPPAQPAPERAPEAPAEQSPGFTAIDLDTFERAARNEVGWDMAPRPIGKVQPVQQPARDAVARERLPGVPRTAPPPPAFDVASAAPRASNGYRARTPSAPNDAAAPAEATSRGPLEPNKARSRLSLVEATGEVPSVIIDMGESVDTLIEQLLQAPPGSEPAQVAELLHIGESVLPVLMQRFPGPLWFDRQKPFKRRPRGRDVSAVAYAIVAFGEPAAPYLASLIGSSDPDRCYYAMMVAGELAHNDLIDPVARRVLDREDAVRLLALEVLRGYSALPQYDVVMRAIAELSERPGKDPRRQRLAVEALGELRDQRALRTLIARLADRDEQVVSAAHRALVILTGQDFGISPRKWESWAEGWGRAHRVEWLIEALLHNDEQVRALAGEELKQLTQQYFGYHPALPRRDRELAQRKYREWWELEGRLAMFATGAAR